MILLTTMAAALVLGSGVALAETVQCKEFLASSGPMVFCPFYAAEQGDGDNTIIGTELPDSMYGRGGNDQLQGNGGGDSMALGPGGNDKAEGGAGDDRISGDSGGDLIHGGVGNDELEVKDGHNEVYGEEGNDSIWSLGSGADNVLNGGPGQDQITMGQHTTLTIGKIYAKDGERDEIRCNGGSVSLEYDAGLDWLFMCPQTTVDITNLKLREPTWNRHRINGYEDLNYLSTDEHIYHGGNTRIYGTVAVKGAQTDELTSLKLKLIEPPRREITAELSAQAGNNLLQPFGPDEEVSIVRPTLLFELPAAEAAQLDSDTNGNIQLRAEAETAAGLEDAYDWGSVEKLVRYKGANRYPPGANPAVRDGWAGGDDWVLPRVGTAADALDNAIAGTVWGDFSNMNGGHFPPHRTHREGIDVDGDYNGYDARDAAVAQDLIDMLRYPVHGTSIQTIYVTYNRRPTDPTQLCERRGRQPARHDADHSAFFRAIRGVEVPAAGGGMRLANAVIEPVEQHCRHFHIRFFPN